MLLVPHGQRMWHVGEVPQGMGKVFEVGVHGLILHRPISYQRTISECGGLVKLYVEVCSIMESHDVPVIWWWHNWQAKRARHTLARH